MSDEDRTWQRLDKWLWCARFMKQRSDCARLVAGGALRINRQKTDKPHAKLRVGDVLTIVLARDIRVVVVQSLAERRGPAEEARLLYLEIRDGETAASTHHASAEAGACGGPYSAAYPRSAQNAAHSGADAAAPADTRSA